MTLKHILLLSLLIAHTPSLFAIPEAQVREKSRTVYGLYLTPHETFNMKQQKGDKVLLIDVRSRAELKYTGSTSLIDANIPTRFLDTEFDWSDHSDTYRTRKNDHFVDDVWKLLSQKGLDASTPLILMCTSGSKVPKAAKLLHEAGFKTVYSSYQGFSGIKSKSGLSEGKRQVYGWKNSGLPWSYRLKKESMYFNFDSSTSQAPH